jgi:hypothetical protein
MKTITFLAGAAALAFSAGIAAQTPPAPVDISRAQAIAAADHRFAQFDSNGDGQLDGDEMRQAFAGRGGSRQERFAQMTPEQRERMEERRAERRRGREGGESGEHGEGRRRGARGPVTLEQFRERALRRFDRLDADGNGVISVAEQEQARARLAERREHGGSDE